MGLGPPAWLSLVVKCGGSLWKGLGGEGYGEKGEVCTHRHGGGGRFAVVGTPLPGNVVPE